MRFFFLTHFRGELPTSKQEQQNRDQSNALIRLALWRCGGRREGERQRRRRMRGRRGEGGEEGREGRKGSRGGGRG